MPVSSPTKDDLLKVLSKIIDPDLNQDIVSLGFVPQAAVCDGIVKVMINLTTPACPVKELMQSQAQSAVKKLPGVKDVTVTMSARGTASRPTHGEKGVIPGAKNVVAVAHRLGITETLPPLPSLALGATEVTPLELTAAYAALANQGNIAWPYVITQIATRDGQVLYQRPAMPVQRVLAPDVVAGMIDMLSANIAVGTGKAARIDRPAAGKTGTSQDYRDAWFMGFTRGLVTGVWVGNDDNSPMNRVTGGGLPAHIWAAFMTRAEAGKPALALLDAVPATQDRDVAATPETGGFDSLLDSLFGELAGGNATPPDDRGGGDR